MPNEQLIDTVISPVVDEQVTHLEAILKELDIQFVANIKTVNQYNAALSNSVSFKEYNKNATQTALGLEKIQQAQNKTAQTTVTLNEAQAKASAAEQLRQDKALLALQKKQAAQATADAKEIAAAEAKSAKLQAIATEAARKAAVQFPASQSSPNPVTQEPSAQEGIMPVGIGNASDYVGGKKAIAAATDEETAALRRQQEALLQLSPEYVANIELLASLKAEQLENAAALKAVNTETVQGAELQTVLIANQLRLKLAVQQTNLELSQQTKQMFAEDTSAAQMQARLDQLRVAYNGLSAAEKENLEIGGVWLAEIKLLDAAVKENAASQGVHNKEVGNYALAQGKASTATVFAEKVSAQFVRQLTRMAAQFLLITVAIGALSWLYDYIKGLDIFTGRLDEAIQKKKALDAAFVSTDYSKAIENVSQLTEDIKLAKEGFLDKTKVLNEYNNTLGSTLGYTDDLNKAEQLLIKNGDAYIRMTLLKAAGQLALQASAKAAYEQAQLAQKRAQDAVGDVDTTDETGFNLTTTPAEHAAALKKMQAAAVADKKKEADLQLKIFDDFRKQAAKIAKDNHVDFFDGTEDTKTGKPKSNKDYANTDLLQAQKINLEEAKKTNKAILDDDNYSFAARRVALAQYLQNSKDMIDVEEKIVKADTTLRNQQKLNEIKKLENQKNDIEREGTQETIRLQKEEVAKQKENLAKILEQTKESEQEQLEALQNGANLAMRILTEAKDAKINALSLERANGKISEQKYNDEILAINDQYAIDRIRQEIATQQTILAIQEGRRDATVTRMRIDGASPDEISKFTSQSNKPIQATKDKIANLGDDLINARSKQTVDNTKSGDKDADARKKAEEFALEQTSRAIDEVDKLRQKAFEAEISRLEKVKEKIDENANNEKLQVQNSIASSATKAREISVIDAQSLSAKKAIDAEIAKQKQKAAIADKEMSIAKIILSTAEAAIKAPAELGPILGLLAVPIVLALGAVELATAIAAPIPKFATGGTTRGGLAIWGEAGMERAVLPDGTVQYSSGPTMQNFPRGTVITPHMELMQQIKPAPVSYVGGEQVGWGEVVKQLKKMEPKAGRSRLNVNVDMGFETYKKSYLRR